jgi:hypothetical protein
VFVLGNYFLLMLEKPTKLGVVYPSIVRHNKMLHLGLLTLNSQLYNHYLTGLTEPAGSNVNDEGKKA